MSEIDIGKIVSGINISRSFIKTTPRKNQVIRAEEVAKSKKARKTQIVGGDSDDTEQTPPTIVIEKDGDRIAKIIVKCPCGRHSELVCEYDDEEDMEEVDEEPQQ